MRREANFGNGVCRNFEKKKERGERNDVTDVEREKGIPAMKLPKIKIKK